MPTREHRPGLCRPWRMPLPLLLAATLGAGLGAANGAYAALIEQQIDVPVSLKNMYGKPVEQNMRVTIWRDDANPAPAPILVLNHGRAAEAAGRANLGRARFTVASRFFVRYGFVVAVPTRVGYGVTGGDDLEDAGGCNSRVYPPVYEAAAQQTIATINAVKALPGTDGSRVVVVGQSFGGTTAITVASHQVPGLKAAINFAGGGGGNPKTHPQQPCGPQKLEQMFGDYGKTSQVPTLWIYTENDQWMGPTYPRQWFNAFQAAGGKGEFVLFPPHGEDGHLLFARFPQSWQPRVAEFLEQQGFTAHH